MKRNAWLVWWCMTLGAGTLGVVLTALRPLSNVRPFETAISQPGARACNPEHFAGGQGVALLGDVSNGETASDCKSALASSWAILYGKEFWRRPAESGSPKGGSALPAHVDLGDIMERVSHAFEPDTNSACSVVRARAYTARFDGAGLRFSPLRLVERNLEPDGNIEATFRTRVVRRGNAMLVSQPSDAASQSVLGNTVQRALSLDAGVIEHYEARREGVEICWVLKQPPAGSGPLVVEAELAGLSYAGESKGGHHFADANGTARVRVGQATLVEANGRRTDLALAVNANVLTVIVPENVLAGATFPVAIDPLLSPEFGMDEPVLSYVINDAMDPAIASNGNIYLAVWGDSRRLAGYHLFGTRISRDGTVLDLRGLPLNVVDGGTLYPAVASNGRDFLVVWRAGFSGGPIVGTRVTAEGVALDTPFFLQIGYASSAHPRPSVASDGTDYLVVWEHEANAGFEEDIFGARVSHHGMVLDSPPLVVHAGPNRHRGPAIAWNGSVYLTVWDDDGGNSNQKNTFGTRLSATGARLDGDGFEIGPGGFETFPTPAVASDGHDFLVALGNQAVRVSGAGAVLGTTPFDADGIPSVTFDGHNYFIMLLSQTIYGVRVSSSGTVLGTTVIKSAVNGWSGPGVASLGGEFFVVWHERPLGQLQVFGAHVSSHGVAADAIPLSTDLNSQFTPAVASNGEDYLVVWSDLRFGTYEDIFGVRVSGGGAVLDPAGIAIRRAPLREWSPAVASDGRDYFVAWQEYPGGNAWQVLGARVLRDGTVTPPVRMSTERSDSRAPAVASNGRDYLIAWSQWSGTRDLFNDIYSARVSGAGVLLDAPPFLINSHPSLEGAPSIASDGENYLVAWEGLYSPTFVSAKRVTSGGVVLDPGGITLTTSTNGPTAPAVAFDGHEYLVVWQESAPAKGTDIFGTRVRTDGTVLDAPPLGIATNVVNEVYPKAASDGREFLVLWHAARGSIYSAELFGRRVTAAGAFVEANPFLIQSAGYYINAQLASNGSNYLAAYSVGDGDGLFRVRGRFINPPLCVAPDDCDGDGVPDLRDRCPETPAGAVVDANGCSAAQRDDDGDGVPNGRDLCPGTTAGALVDTNGCSADQRDSDGDGVPDRRDECPDTPAGSVVDARGCSISQRCPCEGDWGNHGEYVRCVIHDAWDFFRQHRITADQRREIIHDAVMSDCGKQGAERIRLHLLPLTSEECRNEGFQIVLSGDAPEGCTLETSTDLIGWRSVTDEPVMITGWEVVCPSTDDGPTRFYRVRLNP